MFKLGDSFKRVLEKTTDTLQPKDKAWLVVRGEPVSIIKVLDSGPDDDGCGTKYLVRKIDLGKAVVVGNDLTLINPEVTAQEVTD